MDTPSPAPSLGGMTRSEILHDNPTTVQDPAAAPQRLKRQNRQLLADELVATTTHDDNIDDDHSALHGLIEGAPSKNGGRLLTDDRDPWTHNAWDRVEWDDEQREYARQQVERQMQTAVPVHLQQELNKQPASFWDKFYSQVKDGFFNDRAWLRNEFPELVQATQVNAGPKTIVELGCGPGNTLFPLLASNENTQLSLHGYDYSKEAVDLVKANPSFDSNIVTSDVWDLSSKAGLPATIEPGSVDIAVMIFVFSALHPDEWRQAVKNLFDMLKPGGLLLFRDYGRNDMAQLRFKANRFMQPGLYIRGDNTRVYFFERDELVDIFGGLPSKTHKCEPKFDEKASEVSSTTEAPSLERLSLQHDASSDLAKVETQVKSDSKLELVQLGIDRRLLLNRKRKLKMMRVWMQGRWRKPVA
ncbi:hypothetical protein OIO90_000128 [Microbotryomycetes sp. JL221]|nr:hypothetical protein OIO90_000128 [Microbotryomycetes sp. JL221]